MQNQYQFVQASNMCVTLDNYIVDVRNHQIHQFLHDYLVLKLVYKVQNQALEEWRAALGGAIQPQKPGDGDGDDDDDY